MWKTDAPNKMRELRRERARVKMVIREHELKATAQGD
jgi:ribosomal protein L29